jgi:serine/threonine protein phosphatase PrpC
MPAIFDWWKKSSDSLTTLNGYAQTEVATPATRDYAPLNGDLAAFSIQACFLSDAGCLRATNQDCGRLVEPADEELLKTKGHLAIVADGLGGHAGGETASRLAVETISRVYYELTDEWPDDPHAGLQQAFLAANQVIHQTARRELQLYGMGTTCTALALCGRRAYCAHVGDSRLYLLRDDEIYLMSEDHSAVMDLVRRGMLKREAARQHADRNVLLRALGTKPDVTVTSWQKPFPVRANDVFVLCSDGLYDLVEDAEIKSAALAAAPQAACETLIALAKERGGHDNITVGVVRLAADA